MYDLGMRKLLIATCFTGLVAVAHAAGDPQTLMQRIHERLAVISENMPKDEAGQKKVSAALDAADQALAPFAPDSALKTPEDRYGDLIRRSHEGQAKGSLGSIRSALAIYYGDTEGNYPANLDALVPKYIESIPLIELPGHQKTSKVTIIKSAKGNTPVAYVKETGGWLYFADPSASDLYGSVYLDCSHKDSKGRAMSGF
jgi:hypothetical protein